MSMSMGLRIGRVEARVLELEERLAEVTRQLGETMERVEPPNTKRDPERMRKTGTVLHG